MSEAKTESTPILANALLVGDIVTTFEGAFNSSVVIKIDEKWVTTLRPYVMYHNTLYYAGDTPGCGAIISGLGYEELKISRDDTRPIFNLVAHASCPLT